MMTHNPCDRPYQYEAPQFPVWTHESAVTRGPAGEYVAFMTYNVPQTRPVCHGCVGGSTNPNCTEPGSDSDSDTSVHRLGLSNKDPTYMSWTPAGAARRKWTEPVLVSMASPQIDINFAAVIVRAALI